MSAFLELYKICVLFFCTASNLTAGTVYEVAVWAHTDDGDSPTSLFHKQTKGTRPAQPSLKARPLNQTAVECNWTGPQAEVRLKAGIHNTTLKSWTDLKIPGIIHLQTFVTEENIWGGIIH